LLLIYLDENAENDFRVIFLCKLAGLSVHRDIYKCVGVFRKGRHKEKGHKKEEPAKTADLAELVVEQESSDVIEDSQPEEEENIYISDQEEEKRGCYVICHNVC